MRTKPAHRLTLLLAALGGLVAYAPTRLAGLTILVLLAIVAIHEAGHYLAARAVGVAAPEFAIGFGPKLFSTSGKRTGTQFTIRAIPLGGFVRIHGMDANALEGRTDEKPQLRGKPYNEVSHLRRVLISVAGPAANVFSAFLLLMTVFMLAGRTEPSGTVTPAKNSPAAAAGIRAGDRIDSVNGTAISGDELSRYVQQAGESGTELRLGVTGADGIARTVTVEPAKIGDSYKIGVFSDVTSKAFPAWQAAPAAADATGELVLHGVISFKDLGKSFVELPGALLGAENSENRVMSPVGAARIADQVAAKEGWRGPVGLIAGISVFVALFNLLPLPPLDGAHASIAIWEGVMSRIRKREVKVSENVLRPLTALVMACVLVMGLGALLLDVIHPFNLP